MVVTLTKLHRLVQVGFFLLVVLVHPSISAELLEAESVSFVIPAAPLSSFQQSLGTKVSVNQVQDVFQGKLRIPRSSSKVPAAVLIHTCHGETQYLPWIERLNDWGIAALSFSRCQPPDYVPDSTQFPSLDWWRGVPVANGALGFLRRRAEIDADAIAIIAWSRLGIVPLSALNPEGFSQFSPDRFAAAITFYPFCSFARGPHDGPILVLLAEHDDWVDTDVCLRMGRETKNDSYPIRIEVMKDAVHGFDIEAYGKPHFASRSEINPDEFPAAGGTIGYNARATGNAIKLVRAFLREHLSP